MSDIDHLAQAKSALRDVKTALSEEIRSYPTPIAGCDAQFNHLLDVRRRVQSALSELEQPVFIPTPRTPMPNAGIESR